MSELVYARYTMYVLAIQQKPEKSVTSSSSTSSSTSHQTHQDLVLGDISSEESSEFTQNGEDETSGNRVENLTGDPNQLTGELRNKEMSGSRQRKTSPVSSPVSGTPVTQEGLKEMMKYLMLEMFRLAEVEKLPGTPVPSEDVEIIGDKINYKVALNPEIFYRYSIFKTMSRPLAGRVKVSLR